MSLVHSTSILGSCIHVLTHFIIQHTAFALPIYTSSGLILVLGIMYIHSTQAKGYYVEIGWVLCIYIIPGEWGIMYIHNTRSAGYYVYT